MESRWFHRPTFHVGGDGKERKVSWLELFYDLIYVAAIIQLGDALSQHVGLLGFLGFAGLFVPIWLTWTNFTFYSNRFVIDDFGHRLLVFGQMFAIGAMAVSVPGVLNGEPLAFTLAYVVARVAVVAMYVRVFIQIEHARDMTRRYVVGFAAGTALFVVSIFLPLPWVYLAWAVAIGIDFSTVLSRSAREIIGRYDPDEEHMTERYGLLTIIVLGESFVKVLSSLAGAGGTTSQTAIMGVLALTITCSIWWIYFDDVAGSSIKNRRGSRWIWVYMHLPLTLAITGVGVAVKKAVWLDPSFAGAAKYRWLLCGTLGLAFFAVGVIDWVTERRRAELSDRHRVYARIGSAVLILLLAPAGGSMSAMAFLLLVVLVCVLQVAFDISMAPGIEPDMHLSDHGHHAAAVPERETSLKGRPPDVSEAVRKGTPNELRRDLYFHLMEGSWTRVIVSLVAAYVLVNVVFAALYLLEPGSIANVDEGNFLDAFSFSVQTMSTIGYGAMTPETDYAHVLVTIEAAIGLLGAALATGLMFAKAARPRSSVLFSDCAVVTNRYGTPTLMFRAGNARGNEVVEAKVNVTLLRDEVSPEGMNMRTLYDLQLRRDTSPLFMLSWTVMHEIDEESPLYGIEEESVSDHLVALVVTMTGYDATYAQTTHARKVYHSDDLRIGEQLVDVLETLPDGRICVDYNKFHLTEPDEDWEAPEWDEDTRAETLTPGG